MKLKTTQWVVISASILLVVAIYLFADTRKPAAPKPEGPMAVRDKEGQKEEAQEFDWNGYLNQVKSTITNHDTLTLIESWEKGTSQNDLLLLKALYHKRGEAIVEAHYAKQIGLQRRDTMLVYAGDLFSGTAAITSDEALRQYVLGQAVESYKAAVQNDSAVSNRLKLASAFMNQGTAPMQGVGILLDIVAKDPNNVEAQLLLGRFGLVSRQYDKAIVRLEKVVSLRPQNYDALYLLAVAYGSSGNKQKAIELLDKCSRMVTKPELKQRIEEDKKALLNGK